MSHSGGSRQGRCAREITGGLWCVFLTTLTHGRLLVLGVNHFEGVRFTGFVDGDYPWDLSLCHRTGNEEI